MQAYLALLGSNPPLPKAPAREHVCGVQTTFQGLTIRVPGFDAMPYFGPFLASLTPAQRAAVYPQLRAAGDTHLFLSLSYAYQERDYKYPIPPGDFTRNLPAFAAIVREVIHAGFVPVVSLAMDGQDYNPEGWTYGYTWGMANMPRVLDALRPFERHILVFLGYELIGPGGNWTSEQIEAAYEKARALFPKGYLALEMGQGYCKWREGPHGETGWESAGGAAIDVLLLEFPQPLPPIDQPWEGVYQMASRTLGPAYKGPHDGDNPNPPWYLRDGTPRGPYTVVAFEYDLWRHIRGHTTGDEIAKERKRLQSYGFRYVS